MYVCVCVCEVYKRRRKFENKKQRKQQEENFVCRRRKKNGENPLKKSNYKKSTCVVSERTVQFTLSHSHAVRRVCRSAVALDLLTGTAFLAGVAAILADSVAGVPVPRGVARPVDQCRVNLPKKNASPLNRSFVRFSDSLI